MVGEDHNRPLVIGPSVVARSSIRRAGELNAADRYGQPAFILPTNESMSLQSTTPSTLASLFQNGQAGAPGANMASQAVTLSLMLATKKSMSRQFTAPSQLESPRQPLAGGHWPGLHAVPSPNQVPTQSSNVLIVQEPLLWQQAPVGAGQRPGAQLTPAPSHVPVQPACVSTMQEPSPWQQAPDGPGQGIGLQTLHAPIQVPLHPAWLVTLQLPLRQQAPSGRAMLRPPTSMSSMFQPQYANPLFVVPIVQRRYTVEWPSATDEMSKSCKVQEGSATSPLIYQIVTQSVPLLLTRT